ncbi:MAG: cyclic pyranopterin monophosphate synthase MoaC [Aureliella sp.]
MTDRKLSHVDEAGNARMVDVGNKAISRRTAVAEAQVELCAEAADAVRKSLIKKGDVLGVARIAGIAAAKRTDELIPLCHSVPLDKLDVRFEWLGPTRLQILSEAVATGRTGVEMEALVACSNAALTVYDMCKAIDKSIVIETIRLLEKTGGANGDYLRG